METHITIRMNVSEERNPSSHGSGDLDVVDMLTVGQEVGVIQYSLSF